MGKRKDDDEFIWSHVLKISSIGKVKCNYCNRLLKGRTSRIKSHLLRIPNQDVILCDKVPHEVTMELDEINKRRKIISDAGESSRLEPQQVGGRREPTWEPRQRLGASTTRGLNLVTRTKLVVGSTFQKNLRNVWGWLMNDNVQGVGVCGMGGIGKTTLAKHINNSLLSVANPFQHVIWVRVSRDCSIRKLQDAIAVAVGLSLPTFAEEDANAARLRQALLEKKKSLLILDDVWEFVDLERVGVPVGSNACKLVVTSRILSVCRRIACQQIIKLSTLSMEESWNMFLAATATTTTTTTLCGQVEEVAKSVVAKCEGLPLAIVTIANCMRGEVDNLIEWRILLQELEGSITVPMRKQIKEELFDPLKLSYDSLHNTTIKQVFMLCALLQADNNLHCQDEFSNKEDLACSLVANGLIEELESRQIEFDSMHHSLNSLEDASLLSFAKPCMEIHGLVRVMAILIKKESGNVMIEANNKELKHLPDDEKWTSDVKEVFLVDTSIARIDPSCCNPPKCPQLSSLYLCGNKYLESIADSFFQYLSGLKVLDLSGTPIVRLPYSIGELVNLTSLIVCWCRELKYVPPVSKLVALKKLNMGGCGIEQVPRGMELLSGLNYLNLIGTQIRNRELPDGLLTSLPHLQFLMVDAYIKLEDLEALKKLETLICGFNFHGSLNQLTHVINDAKRQRLNRFSLYIGDVGKISFNDASRVYSKLGSVCEQVVKLVGGRVGGGEDNDDLRPIFLPDNIQCLVIKDEFPVGKSLVLQSGGARLRCLAIRWCRGLECLCSSSSNGIPLESLEVLELRSLNGLLNLFGNNGNLPPFSSSAGVFCQLRRLSIGHCPKIVTLFPPNLLANLQKLEQLNVKSCVALQVISEDENNNIMLNLPKLKILELMDLPELQRISCGTMICAPSLQKIRLICCKKLLNIPIHLPIPSLELVAACPEDWWHSVCWGNRDSKARLPLKSKNYFSDTGYKSDADYNTDPPYDTDGYYDSD